MAVGPVTLNGVIPRAHDVGSIKQQEDNKPMLDQHQIQTHMKTQENRRLKQVNHADDTEQHQKKYDAKEKGSNEYKGQQDTRKKPKEKNNNREKAIFQQEGGRFDMKI